MSLKVTDSRVDPKLCLVRSAGVGMEEAKSALNEGFKVSDWMLTRGSLQYVTLNFYLRSSLFDKSLCSQTLN